MQTLMVMLGEAARTCCGAASSLPHVEQSALGFQSLAQCILLGSYACASHTHQRLR